MTKAERELVAAAMRVYRQRNNVDAEFWKIDATCTCSWCSAKRNFLEKCQAYKKENK